MTPEIGAGGGSVGRTVLAVLVWLAISGSAFAQSTHLLIVVGLPGDPEHGELFKKWGTTLADTATQTLGIDKGRVTLLSVLDALPGKTIILGVLALDTAAVETPETVAERIRRALPHKGVGELIAAPDCGMKYLPRDAAFAKLQALVAGAQLVRAGPGT